MDAGIRGIVLAIRPPECLLRVGAEQVRERVGALGSQFVAVA